MLANYKLQTELSAIDSTEDGNCVILGAVDGSLTILAIADPKKTKLQKYLAQLPSRNQTVSPQHHGGMLL